MWFLHCYLPLSLYYIICTFSVQGPNCGECKPFFVGSPDQSGGECSPCLEFCNGKSAVCVKESDFQDFFGRINYEVGYNVSGYEI